jgi:hypothetical protein
MINSIFNEHLDYILMKYALEDERMHAKSQRMDIENSLFEKFCNIIMNPYKIRKNFY